MTDLALAFRGRIPVRPLAASLRVLIPYNDRITQRLVDEDIIIVCEASVLPLKEKHTLAFGFKVLAELSKSE